MTAIQRMKRVDSFLKESLRLNTVLGAILSRRATRDFTFSDGTFIPKGAFVSTPATAIHHDEEYYDNAQVFKPWRFFDAAGEEDDDGSISMKHHLSTTSKEYLPFGHGKHACPGRFFASLVLKTMVAHTVMYYDIALVEGHIPPPMRRFGGCMPNPTANVLFRRRQT